MKNSVVGFESEISKSAALRSIAKRETDVGVQGRGDTSGANDAPNISHEHREFPGSTAGVDSASL